VAYYFGHPVLMFTIHGLSVDDLDAVLVLFICTCIFY